MKKGDRIKKGAQTTIFIITAILIVTVVGTGSYMFYNNRQAKLTNEFFSQPENKVALENLKDSMVECLKTSSEEGLITIGVQGGYYKAQTENFEVEGSFVPYYYFEGKFLMPTLEKIESELANYIDDKLGDCISNVDNRGFNIDYDSPRTKAKIDENYVFINTDLEIILEKEGYKTNINLKDAPYNKESKLYDIYEVAKYLTNTHSDDPQLFCITCLADIVTDKNLYVDILPVSDLITVVIISDTETESIPYSFIFLNKYTGEETSPEIEVTDLIGESDVPEAMIEA